MAENRFDGLSKKLSTRFSRRTMLKGAGAAVGAGAVASVAGSAASAGSLFCLADATCPLTDQFNTQHGWASAQEILPTGPINTVFGNTYYYNVNVQLRDVPRGPVSSYGVWLLLNNNTIINGDRGQYKYLGIVKINLFGSGNQCWNVIPSVRYQPVITQACPEVLIGVGNINNAPSQVYWRTTCCINLP